MPSAQTQRYLRFSLPASLVFVPFSIFLLLIPPVLLIPFFAFFSGCTAVTTTVEGYTSCNAVQSRMMPSTITITPSAFHSRLKTALFHKSFPP